MVMFRCFYENDEKIFAYTRSYENEKLLVVMNFSEEEVEFCTPKEIFLDKPELLISNYEVEDDIQQKIVLKPYESRVYKT